MTYTIARDTNVVSVIVTDIVTLQDCIRSVDGLLAEAVLRPGMQLLVDATNLKPELSFDDLRNLVGHVERLVRRGLDSIAIIATSDLVFGLARTFSAYGDIHGFNVAAFRTQERALTWLEASRAASHAQIRNTAISKREMQ